MAAHARNEARQQAEIIRRTTPPILESTCDLNHLPF